MKIKGIKKGLVFALSVTMAFCCAPMEVVAATLAANPQGTTVETINEGDSMGMNNGAVTNNEGTVENNLGTVNTNTHMGSVTLNHSMGIIHNFGGSVFSNGGTVYNYHKITVTGATDKITIDVSTYPGTGVAPAGEKWVLNTTGTVTITPQTGYGINVTGGNCTTSKTATGYELSNVTSDLTVSVVEKEIQAKPVGLSDGNKKILGTTVNMEYASALVATQWTTCTDGSTVVTAGDWYVRYKESDTHFSSEAVMISISTLENYTITYNSNGGTGTMSDGTAIEEVAFTLPANNFTAPQGKQFKCWAVGSISSLVVKNPGETYIFTGQTTVYALWEDIPVVEPVEPIVPVEPTQPQIGDKTGWDAIKNEIIDKVKDITDSSEKITITIDMNTTTQIQGDVIDAIKGKNVDLVIDMGNGIKWTINGKDVTGSDIGDIDLGVTTGTFVL